MNVKEIAEKILEINERGKFEFIPISDKEFKENTATELARAYLELEKEKIDVEMALNYFNSNPSLIPEAEEILENYAKKDSTIDSGNLFFAACEYRLSYMRTLSEITKLKKSRECLREALEHTWPGSTYAIDVNAFNRRAINLDDEIMKGE